MGAFGRRGQSAVGRVLVAVATAAVAMLCLGCTGTGADADASDVPVASGSAAAADELLVRFVDVGQGDCALISCGGENMLVDGGNSANSQKLYAILDALGIGMLDAVVVTHPDSDHSGGVLGALHRAECGMCFCSSSEADTRTFEKLVDLVESQGAYIMVPEDGDSFTLGSARVTFIGSPYAHEDENDSSLVLRIDHGSFSFLFTGDISATVERELVSKNADIAATVLKVSHHGSAASSCSEFLQVVRPTYSVISVGKDNSYGHPSDEVIGRLEAVGSAVHRTDEEGSIVFRSDGKVLRCEAVRGNIVE